MDPFYEPPLPRTYYHPSPPLQKSRKERTTAISPERLHWEMERLKQQQKKNPSEEAFLKGTNTYSAKRMPTNAEALGEEKDDSAKFDESWPASERPSTLVDDEHDSPLYFDSARVNADRLSSTHTSSHSSRKDSSRSSHRDKGDPKSMQDFNEFMVPERDGSERKQSDTRSRLTDENLSTMEQESVLARYVARFRHGEPMSREERERQELAKKDAFWWLQSEDSTPNSTSTPKEGSGKTKARTDKDTSYHLQDHLDEKSALLEQQANKLLEQTSASSIGSVEPAVSTDGLGSTSESTQGSSFHEEPYRPGFTRPYKPGGHFTVQKPKKPEDDILTQWRLRRRIETARSKVTQQQEAKPAVRQGTANEEMDLKLAEFRRHLADAASASSPLKPAVALDFTPAPSSSVVHQTEMAPVPSNGPSASLPAAQTVVPAVSNVAPSALTGVPAMPTSAPFTSTVTPSASTAVPVSSTIVSPPAASMVSHMIPSAATAGDQLGSLPTAMKDTVGARVAETHKTPPRPCHSHSPIASPHLPRRRADVGQSTDSDVAPHLHLSCDILPCPHGESPKHSREQWYSEDSLRDSMEFQRAVRDSDSSFERVKHRHLRQLQKEAGRRDVKREQNRKLEELRDSTERVSGDEIVEHSKKETENRVTQRQKETKQKGKENVLKADQKSTDKKLEHEKGQQRAKQKSKKLERDPDRTVPKQLKEPQKAKAAKHRDNSPARDYVEDNQGAKPMKSKTKESVLPEPKYHSSPKQSVHGTIDQVVKEHLFNSSTPSPSMSGTRYSSDFEASSESSASEAVKEDATGKVKETALPSNSEQGFPYESIDLAELLVSDDEEFSDDSILHDLRQKRLVYLARLWEIDQMLQSS